MICHRPLEGLSFSKLKAGCLSRVTPQPLGTMLLQSASMGSDSTQVSEVAQYGHSESRLPHVTYCPLALRVLIRQVAFYLVCTEQQAETGTYCTVQPYSVLH